MDGRKKAARVYAAQSIKEYLYGALAIIWIFFAMLIASDGMIAVGVIGGSRACDRRGRIHPRGL